MSNRKTLWIIAGIAVIAAIVVIVARSSNTVGTSTGKPTVVIGVTLPLTGDVAMLGQSAKNAIELSQSQLPSGLKYDYKVVFEDDQFKPALGATIANKLISIDNADALMSFGSPVGNVVSPIAQKAGVVHVNAFASAASVADGDYNFVDYTPSYEDSKLFIPELEKRGIKKIVFFGQQDNPGVISIINSFLKDVKNTDIQVLSTQMFNTGTRDFRTSIDKVKGLGADIYVLEASSPELEILARQLRDAGVQTPVTTMEAFEFSDQLSLFEGMWYVNGADPQKWFVDLYTKTYGQAPKFGAANQYDGFDLIVKAVETAGDGKTVPSHVEIKDALTDIKSFDGALGTGQTIDPNGIVDSKAVVRIIKNGVPMTIQP